MKPIITTKRLRLIPRLRGDSTLNGIQAHWLNDPEVVKYSEQRHQKHNKGTVERYIKSFDQQKDHLLGIFLKGEGPLEDYYIGNISVHRDKNNGIAEMGILIGEKQHWGKGYAREAWQAVMDWVLSNGVRKIEAGCMTTNGPMRSLALATEMSFEGARDDHFVVNGMTVDMDLYGKHK